MSDINVDGKKLLRYIYGVEKNNIREKEKIKKMKHRSTQTDREPKLERKMYVEKGIQVSDNDEQYDDIFTDNIG